MVSPALILGSQDTSATENEMNLHRKHLGNCPRLFVSFQLASQWHYKVLEHSQWLAHVSRNLLMKTSCSLSKSVAWLWYKCIVLSIHGEK